MLLQPSLVSAGPDSATDPPVLPRHLEGRCSVGGGGRLPPTHRLQINEGGRAAAPAAVAPLLRNPLLRAAPVPAEGAAGLPGSAGGVRARPGTVYPLQRAARGLSRDPALRTDPLPTAQGWARPVGGTWGRAEGRLLGCVWEAAAAFGCCPRWGSVRGAVGRGRAVPCRAVLTTHRVPLCCGCRRPRAWAARAPSGESRGCGTGSRLLVVLCGRPRCGAETAGSSAARRVIARRFARERLAPGPAARFVLLLGPCPAGAPFRCLLPSPRPPRAVLCTVLSLSGAVCVCVRECCEGLPSTGGTRALPVDHQAGTLWSDGAFFPAGRNRDGARPQLGSPLPACSLL